jgi:hypothetical protein
MSNFSDYDKAFKQGLQQNDTNYNNVLIKPPERNITHKNINKTLVIDSRDRDYVKYPESNLYRVEITEEYRDITALELVYGQLPNSYYNIKSTNNKFYISENGSTNIYNIEIPEGQYTNETLLNILNGDKSDLFYELENKYNFSRDENNLKCRIQSNNYTNNTFVYNLNYEMNNECNSCPIKSIDQNIGFLNKTYISEIIDLSYIYVPKNQIIYLNKSSDNDYKLYKITATSNTNKNLDFRSIFVKGDYLILNAGTLKYSCRIYKILNDKSIEIESLDNSNPIALFGNIFNNINILYSQHIYNIENKPYVILKISEAKLLTSLSSSSHNAYTLIPLTEKNTIINKGTLPEHGIIKYFNPPLGKLFWLDIKFLNYDGSLFDFRGQENMLMFSVSQLNQPGRYNNSIDPS